MLIDTIKTGDRVEIGYRYMSSGTKPYVSKVETVVKKTQILIHAPISLGAVIRLPKEEQYVLRFVSERGICRFSAKIINYSKDEGFPMVMFKILDEGIRIQNRDFFRMACSIPIKFSIVQEVDDESEPLQYEGLIRDLGGGGMKMYSKLDMAVKTMITGVLQIEDEKLLIFGEIRHRVHNIGAVVPYQYGIKFASMSKTDQEKLVQYLTNEQLKALQRAR